MHTLFLLRWKGTICPCLEPLEDQLARLSATYLLSKSGWRVQWHQKSDREDEEDGDGDDDEEEEEGSSAGGGGGLGGFMSSLSNVVSTVASKTSKALGATRTVHAKLSLQDSPRGPCISVVATVDDEAAGGAGEGGGGDGGENALQRRLRRGRSSKTVLLKHVGAVLPSGTNGFKLIGHTSGDGKEGDKLLKCDLLGVMDDDAFEVARSEFIEHLTNVVVWDRRKREGTVDDDDDGGRSSGLKGRAQRAAHFAKREIEMKQQKREREARKAKYLEKSGGLKYTALAMAQRAEG